MSPTLATIKSRTQCDERQLAIRPRFTSSCQSPFPTKITRPGCRVRGYGYNESSERFGHRLPRELAGSRCVSPAARKRRKSLLSKGTLARLTSYYVVE